MTVTDLESFLQRANLNKDGDADKEEEEEANQWCGELGCKTNYYHEHIGKGQSSLVREKDWGSNALKDVNSSALSSDDEA